MPAAAVYLLPGFSQATAQAITQRDGGSSRPAAHAHLGIQEGKHAVNPQYNHIADVLRLGVLPLVAAAVQPPNRR